MPIVQYKDLMNDSPLSLRDAYIGLDLHFNQNCFTIEALKRFDVGFDLKNKEVFHKCESAFNSNIFVVIRFIYYSIHIIISCEH